jgi:hypothetical protein
MSNSGDWPGVLLVRFSNFFHVEMRNHSYPEEIEII